MNDQGKTKRQLLDEIAQLREQIAKLKGSPSRSIGAHVDGLQAGGDSSQPRSQECSAWTGKDGNEPYKAMFHNAAIGITVADREYRLKMFNPHLIDMLGYNADELQDCSLANITYPEDVEVSKERHDALLHGEIDSYRVEKRYRRKDGTTIWAEAAVSAMRDREGNFLGTVGVILETTERRKIEDALRHHEELLASILATSPVAIVMTKDRTITWVNDACREMFGFYREIEYIFHSTQLGYTSEAEYERIGELILTGLDKGRVSACDASFRRKDGTTFQGHIRMKALDPSDLSKGTIATIVDVSEQRQAEEDLRRAHDLLEQRVLQRTGEFLKANEQLKEEMNERTKLEEQLRQAAKMEAVGRLAGGVAHDFSNLLTAILGYSNLLLKQSQRDDSDRDKLEQILLAAEKASRLTQQLLAFSRKQVLEVKELDFNLLIDNLEKILSRTIGEDIELVTVFEPSLGKVLADQGQIEQIVVNLAVNARDAMPRGGKLTMETHNVSLDEDYARAHPEVTPGPHVMFAVSDTGIGMDQEIISKIFEPFFTTKDPGRGTGLGLSTVFGIVKQHQGHVSVYSEQGRGTTFKVYLPRVESSRRPRSDDTERSPHSGGTETVMVVEDEEIVRRFATEALRLLGYRALAAQGPEAALEIARKHEEPIDLLLTDVVMPHLDGQRLYNVIVKMRPKIKVLYMSGYAGNAIVHHGVLDPGVAFLQKPLTMEKLASKVREVLDGD
jgi:two-component system, cell cycle sensor histidine kinase and response regulator CckA